MSHIRCILITALLFSVAFGFASVNRPTRALAVEKAPSRPQKLALLVGIDKYQYQSDLSGAGNDVDKVKALLTEVFEFPEDNIVVLRDDQATRDSILAAFDELIEKAREDSVALFHYSGHGSSRRDGSGDESDGYDETLVPYDSGRAPHPNRDLSDDELNALLQRLTSKTRNVTVVLDSCFSGSALRAAGAARTVKPDPRPAPDLEGAARGVGDGAGGFRPDKASYVLIAGAEDREQAYEFRHQGNSYGALSWHLTEQIRNAAPGATYRDVMDVVASEVSTLYPRQHPQLEGARSDNLVFADRSVAPQPYVLAEPQADGRVKLKAGRAHGVTAQSIFAVYPPGAKSFREGQQAARVRVTEVDSVESFAELVEEGKVEIGSRALEREHYYEDLTLGIYFENPEESPTLRQVMEPLLKLKHIQRLPARDGAHLTIAQREGFIVTEAGEPGEIWPRVAVDDEEFVEKVKGQVEKWVRWYRVQALRNPASDLRIDVQVELPESRRSLNQDREIPRLSAGEKFAIKVENQSERELFITLLDVSSDGSIDVVYPRLRSHETLENGGMWEQELETFLPEGHDSVRDVLLVIATTNLTDFSILRQGAVRGGLDLDPLQQLLAHAAYGDTRGSRLVDAGDWTTAKRVIEVTRD